jgi:hypothetical protein
VESGAAQVNGNVTIDGFGPRRRLIIAPSFEARWSAGLHLAAIAWISAFSI